MQKGKVMQTTEDIINKIKDVGQSLIDNAASIAGDYYAQTDLNIQINIPVTNSGLPKISVETEFICENAIKRSVEKGETFLV